MEQGNLVLNPKYYMGYLPVLGPIVIPGDDASSQPAVSKGIAARFVPAVAASFRMRPRKQIMKTRQEVPSAAQLAIQQAAQAQADNHAAEVAKVQGRHERQAATRRNQETRAHQLQQQAQALEATRATQKANAAAARRAVPEDPTLLVHQLTSFARVPKAANHSRNKADSSSEAEGKSAGQANKLKGPTAPSTPPKKAVGANPSSPTSSGSFVEADCLKFCNCCFAESSPIWRRGGLAPYEGLTLCNACGMWEMHNHMSLVHSGKEAKCVDAFLAKHGKFPAAAGEITNILVKAAEPKATHVAAPLQASIVGHGYGTRSSLSAAAAAAGGGSQVVQQGASSVVDRQPMQQVGSSADMDSVPEAAEAPSAACKRKAVNGTLQHCANKRSKVASQCSPGAVISKEGRRGLDDGLQKHAAADGCGDGEGDKVALDGAPDTARRRPVLRLRKGKSTTS